MTIMSTRTLLAFLFLNTATTQGQQLFEPLCGGFNSGGNDDGDSTEGSICVPLTPQEETCLWSTMPDCSTNTECLLPCDDGFPTGFLGHVVDTFRSICQHQDVTIGQLGGKELHFNATGCPIIGQGAFSYIQLSNGNNLVGINAVVDDDDIWTCNVVINEEFCNSCETIDSSTVEADCTNLPGVDQVYQITFRGHLGFRLSDQDDMTTNHPLYGFTSQASNLCLSPQGITSSAVNNNDFDLVGL